MLTLRKANNLGDAEILAEHNCAMAMETESKALNFDVVKSGVLGLLERPEYGFYLVAEMEIGEGRDVAATLMVTYEWSDWRNGLFWWVQSVYVRSHYRRQGVYRAMYEYLQAESKQSEIPVCGLRLYVETQNFAAQKTYADCGMGECDYLMFEQLFGHTG